MKRLISKEKISFVGSSTTDGREFYKVAGILVEVNYEFKPDYRKFEIDVEKDLIKKPIMSCTCKDCTCRRIPAELPPRCIFTTSLKKYLNDQRQNKS